MSLSRRKQWAKWTAQPLANYLRNEEASVVWVLAGVHYREFLLPLLIDFVSTATFKVPLQGMGIGKQKQWLKQAISEDQ
jgi:hypothetical protein